MLASDSLIGCETFTGDDSCTRPKAEFMFLREDSNKSPFLLFAHGTHCEIFDLISNLLAMLLHNLLLNIISAK